MSGTFAIGMDLGGTHARAAAVDRDGRVLQLSKESLHDRSPEAAADTLAACVRRILATLGHPLEECAGIGLGLAAQIDARTGRIIVSPNLGWRDLDFSSLLAERLGAPVHLANDLAVAALGEAKVGAAKGFADAVLVFVGSGIGSGLILGGRLHRGSRGIAGELGHTKVRPGGRRCGCGELGCLEAYAGGRALGDRVVEAIASGRSTSLSALVPDGLRPSASMIDVAADQGDAVAAEIRDDAATLLGVAAANLVTELNPSVLILGGGVLLGAPTLRARVEEVLRANAARAALAELYVVAPALGDDAGVIGAATLAWP